MFCGDIPESEKDINTFNFLDSRNGRCSECDERFSNKNDFTNTSSCKNYWNETSMTSMNLWSTAVLQPFDDHDHSSLAILVIIFNVILILVWQKNARVLHFFRLLSGVAFAFFKIKK